MTAEVMPSGVVTFLLTDVVGSTVLWERSPLEMERALGRHDSIIEEEVRGHGGRLLKTKGEGDATFSVFARATDAVAAPIACQRRFEAEDWPAGVEMRLRWAVATGEAVERDGDYYGTTVNRVARLRALAAGGDVLLAQSTVDVVADHLPAGVRLIDLGDQALRDLTRPEHVWKVVSYDAARTADDVGDGDAVVEQRAVRPPLPPVLSTAAERAFVAREAELNRLVEIAGGRGRRLVCLRGEQGIGKSRLAAELARIAHDTGTIVLFGRCEEGLDAPYRPIVEALRHWVTNVAAVEVSGAAGYRRSLLARLVPEMGAARDDAAPIGPGEQYAMFEAVDELLASVAASTPVLLVLDDVHWADRPSLLLLRHLARSDRGGDLMVLATYCHTDLDRTHPLADVLADLRRDGSGERIDLGCLGLADTARLMVLLGARLESDRLDRVVAETEGNPFFATELARHFAEAADGLGGVPEGIRDTIRARLSRLSPLTYQVLTMAAVVGRDFGSDVVAAMGGPRGDELLDALEAATATHVLEEVTDAFGRYRFAHGLVRQSLLAELSVNRRARLHTAAGRALANPRPDDLTAIADHFAEGALAGDPLSAAEWSIKAGPPAMTAAA